MSRSPSPSARQGARRRQPWPIGHRGSGGGEEEGHRHHRLDLEEPDYIRYNFRFPPLTPSPDPRDQDFRQQQQQQEEWGGGYQRAPPSPQHQPHEQRDPLYCSEEVDWRLWDQGESSDSVGGDLRTRKPTKRELRAFNLREEQDQVVPTLRSLETPIRRCWTCNSEDHLREACPEKMVNIGNPGRAARLLQRVAAIPRTARTTTP